MMDVGRWEMDAGSWKLCFVSFARKPTARAQHDRRWMQEDALIKFK